MKASCVAVLVFCGIAYGVGDSNPVEPLDEVSVRLQLAAGEKAVTLQLEGQAAISAGRQTGDLPAGAYTVRGEQIQRARQRFHVFTKTFLPSEMAAAREYANPWKSQGYAPEIIVMGRQFRIPSGGTLDNRNLWISMARADTEDKAEAIKKKLEAQDVWAWVWPEIVEQGKAKLTISDSRGKALYRVPAPLRIESKSAIVLRNMDTGFWKAQQRTAACTGPIEIGIGVDGLLSVCETLSMEAYLAGVLPAEMPSEWPIEALKAQAVAARSEILASLSGKHKLEGFDFCASEHCRAYRGQGGRERATDMASQSTKGIVLVANGRAVPTVFCANCGGWTEDNETVWSGPANPLLRGVTDLVPKKSSSTPKAINQWLKARPPAFCGNGNDNYRWTRRFSARELTELVNRHYAVGTVRSIELGERGVSGRLKWVKVIGTKRSEVIRKELNIRLAFGGLPSAMFMVETSGTKGSSTFKFVGGGRGHGVGLCQDGAKGRAVAGQGYREILGHYFPRAEIVRMP